jgi:hypothetical protein
MIESDALLMVHQVNGESFIPDHHDWSQKEPSDSLCDRDFVHQMWADWEDEHGNSDGEAEQLNDDMASRETVMKDQTRAMDSRTLNHRVSERVFHQGRHEQLQAVRDASACTFQPAF